MTQWDEASGPAHDDLMTLLDVALPYARRELERAGMLLPFGATISRDGLVGGLTAHDAGLEPPNQLTALENVFRNAHAAADEQRAVVVVANARHDGEAVLRVHFEHREGPSLALFVPYSRSVIGGAVHLGRMTGGRTDPVIWGV